MSEELTAKYRELVKDPFELVKVERCNFKPHPIMIGSEHVVYASDHRGGMLTTDVIDKIGCAWQEKGSWQKCRGKTADHTSDLVVFVMAMRDCTNKEAAQALFAFKEQMVEDKIDGVAFVKSAYTIAPPEDKP